MSSNEPLSGVLWIDVTMLVNWSGRMTGIQRVEYNLASRFSKYENVRFCVFNKTMNRLVDFEFKHIEYKISHQQLGTINEPVNEVQTRLIKKHIKSLIRNILPNNIHKKLSVTYKNGFKQNTPPQQAIDFNKGDRLLILSGDWSDNSFADLVSNERQKNSIEIIQIVYDMLPALYPSYFVPGMPDQFSNYMKKLFANCDRIFAISESTKNDIKDFMYQNKIDHVEITVFRLGDDFVKVPSKKPKNQGFKSGEFTLTVSTVEARKNHLIMYYAMRESILQGVEIPAMVIAGKKGWLVDDFYYLVQNDPIMSQKILLIQPDDDELSWLYQNCLFTIFPSFYEGWGLPVAESMFYGKFCLSSNRSSMPEIAGSLIDYFSPNDAITLLDKIIHYSSDSDILRTKEKRIKESYKPTSWDNTFDQIRSYIN